MAKKNIKGPAPENTGNFHQALMNLLREYNLYEDGDIVNLKTSKLKFRAEDVSRCPPECLRMAEVCDKNGRNCKIVVWCECD